MKFYFKSYRRKSDNTFLNYGVGLEACCDRILAFILTNEVDYSTGDNALIVKKLDSLNPTMIKIYFCPFCGTKNESQQAGDLPNKIKKEKGK